MKLDQFDKITKDRCCVLPVDIQIKTGYKTRKQFASAINNIYKSVRNQRDFGGVGLASAPLVNIARMMIEGTEEPIRTVNLIGEDDPPIRPMADTYAPLYKGISTPSGSKTPREIELEGQLRESQGELAETQGEMRREIFLRQMAQEGEQKIKDEYLYDERLNTLSKNQKLSNDMLKAEYRSLMNLSGEQAIPARYTTATKLDKIKFLIAEGLITLEELEERARIMDIVESSTGRTASAAGLPTTETEGDDSSIGTVSEVASEGARSDNSGDYPE